MELTYLRSPARPELRGTYWPLCRTVHQHAGLFRLLGTLETLMLGQRVPRVESPIFICGLARSGTTVTLEMLHGHPDTASFRYLDMAQPYLPFTWNLLWKRCLKQRVAFQVERPHGDGLMMAPGLPEAVEEIFWHRRFRASHDERYSSILDMTASDAGFNRFYLGQIGKLLLARGKSRYLAKANYHVTRLAYLNGLFKSPRILIMVRHPFRHALSYLKQQDRLSRLYRRDARWWQAAEMLGHYEFGDKVQFINPDDIRTVRKIRALWDRGRRVEAFAYYWDLVYGHVYQTVADTCGLSEACLFVRYEDLCRDSGLWIDRILDHCRLNRSGFIRLRQRYLRILQPPGYYRASLDPCEKSHLWRIVRQTAELFGYDKSAG